MAKRIAGLAAVVAVLGTVAAVWVALRHPAGVIHSVGPRLVSNQTDVPLALYGEDFQAGDQVALTAPDGTRRKFPLAVMDPRHAYARVPAGAWQLAPTLAQAQFKVGLGDGPPEAELTVVNDAAFVDLTALALSPDGKWAFAASPTTDAVYAIDLGAKGVKAIPAGDGPAAVAGWTDPAGRGWMVVAHRFAPELRLFSVDGPAAASRSVPGPSNASGLVVDGKNGVAFVAEQARDSVWAISLPDGRVLWKAEVAPNPAAMALALGRLWVGSLQAGVIDALDPTTGKRLARVSPSSKTKILGGHTEPYASLIMGGKAPRGLAGSEKLGKLFVASVGPNIGPNPDRMEVTMNGGVGVVSPEGGFLHHLGFNAGVPEAIAIDEGRGRIYLADIGAGLIRVIDAGLLAAADRKAELKEIPIPPPAGFPLVRPAADFGVHHRAGVEVHSGPVALAVSPGGQTVYALDRFTGTLAVIDAEAMALKEQLPIAPTLGQRTRRLGEILYFADLGRSAMSCDTCHLEGHTEGVLFEKTHPMRIYRSTTVRGARETPPYFTPASTHSIGATVEDVGDRNRYHNPDLTVPEIDALTTYTAAVTTLPNPFLGPDGAPPDQLTLLDGKVGHPRAGMALFEGKAQCAGCHPAPLFTTDQDPATRGRYLDVGTPKLFPLRTQWQELKFVGAGVPSLVGAWDIFPMLTTGSAGFGLDGDQLVISNRFALREVIEKFGGPGHGHTEALTAAEKDDLLAYLMTL